MPPLPQVYLVRHGETGWAVAHKYAGRTDVPLTPHGEDNARQLAARLAGIEFAQAFTSPLQRARRTCKLAGFGERAKVDPELVEVDYGRYEGRRTEDILKEAPDWDVFRDGCPEGESAVAVVARVEGVIARLRSQREGNVLLFAHKDFLRFLAVRWIGLPAVEGRRLVINTASVSILGYGRTLDEPVIRLWNDDRHVVPSG